MMKTRITTEITPIVGSEQQSQELIDYILKEFESNPSQIWDSNILEKVYTSWSMKACTTS